MTMYDGPDFESSAHGSFEATPPDFLSGSSSLLMKMKAFHAPHHSSTVAMSPPKLVWVVGCEGVGPAVGVKKLKKPKFICASLIDSIVFMHSRIC